MKVTPGQIIDNGLSALVGGTLASCRALGHVLWPRVCTVCRVTLVEGEEIMCVGCRLDLPVVNLHGGVTFPPMAERLVSLHVPLRNAAALYHYTAGSAHAALVHDTKYRHRPRVGRILASRHASELKRAGFFDGVDMIMPMPLHFTRLLARGYNQARAIAEGLATEAHLPVADNLVSLRPRATQTRKDALMRRTSSYGLFGVHRPQQLEGKHILLVDDVVTTGSTMLAALEAMAHAVPSATFSVYALGLTATQ